MQNEKLCLRGSDDNRVYNVRVRSRIIFGYIRLQFHCVVNKERGGTLF